MGTTTKAKTTKKNPIAEVERQLNAGAISEKQLRQLLDKMEKKAKNQIQPGTKAYSEKNMKITIRMISEGATSPEIMALLGVSRQTVKNYIFRYYKKPGNAQKCWDKLLENDRKAKETEATTETQPIKTSFEQTTDELVETVINQTEVPAIEMVKTESQIEYILDNQLVQRHDGRIYWAALIAKLRATHSNFVIYSKSKMHVLAKEGGISNAKLAQEILGNPELNVLDTRMPIQYAAATLGATVITNTSRTEDYCKKVGVEVVTVSDFLDITEVLDPEKEEYARKHTLPVRKNKLGRIIADVDKLCKYFEEYYATTYTNVAVFDEAGTPRKTPTGQLCLKRFDTIKVSGVDGDSGEYYIEVTLKVIDETDSENCCEVAYNKRPRLISVQKKAQ